MASNKSQETELYDQDGLIINNKRITSISGPISFYYLRPTQEVYSDGNGKYFPLVFLFGDKHRSTMNYCSPCNCSLDSEFCCYKLSDPSFLSSIDQLASTYAIDFYTETFFEGTGSIFKEGGMMEEMTTGDMITCYNRDLRGTPEDRCPTKNIRWQAGDIRHAGTYLRDFLDKKDTKFVKSEKYLNNSYIEYQLATILNLITQFLANYNTKHKNKESASIMLDKIVEVVGESEFKDFQTFHEFLLSILDDNDDNDSFDFKKFANSLFGMMNKNNSAIYKQVLKQTYRNFNDIKEWEDFYNRSLKFCSDTVNIDKYYTTHIILNLYSYVANESIIEYPFVNVFHKFVTCILSGLTDIYFTARMFKQPTDGKRSDLTIAYFGNYHIQIVKDLLLSTGAYELVVSKNERIQSRLNPTTDRCLYFNEKIDDINLNKELENHK